MSTAPSEQGVPPGASQPEGPGDDFGPFVSTAPPPPSGRAEFGHYRVRFAASEQELDEIFRLRFRVFNEELGEGLESSYSTGRDIDAFDRSCHHLLVEDKQSGQVIGTYRIQTTEMAETADCGLYSAGEFDLSSMPAEVLSNSVEIGRACIAREHRNRQVLFLLWKGLALYMTEYEKRFLFGCCSLTSQDETEGRRVERFLRERGHYHPEFHIEPLPALSCAAPPEESDSWQEVEVPSLFRTYLRYGAKVLSPPAIDRDFKTIDYFVLFDIDAMDPRSRQLFFG